MAGLLISGTSFGQDMAPKEKKSEEIIIKKSGDSSQKMTVEINGNDVTINGKPLSDYQGGDVQIIRKDFAEKMGPDQLNGPGGNPMQYEMLSKQLNDMSGNQAFLGVMTEKADKGVKVSEVMKGTAADKAGLKAGDLITKLGDKDINSPSDLLAAVKAHKPGDEVEVTYLRDDKQQETKVTLGHRSMDEQSLILNDMLPPNGNSFDFHMPNMDMMPGNPQWNPHQYGMPYRNFRFFNFNNINHPKIGLKIQDTQDNSGVKVMSVEEGSPAAKAGIKKNDLITSVNGDKVSGVDEVTGKVAQSENGGTVDIKALRNGKEMNFQVKVPKNLKSADL